MFGCCFYAHKTYRERSLRKFWEKGNLISKTCQFPCSSSYVRLLSCSCDSGHRTSPRSVGLQVDDLEVLKLHRRLKDTASNFLSSARGAGQGGLSCAHWVTQNFTTRVSLDTFAFRTVTCSNSCFWSVPCPSSPLQLDMPFPASGSKSSRGTQPVQLHA